MTIVIDCIITQRAFQSLAHVAALLQEQMLGDWLVNSFISVCDPEVSAFSLTEL